MAKNKYILFLGDSFTWGQGLYLPSWVERKPEVFDNFLETHKTSNKEIGMQWVDQQEHFDLEDLKIKEKLSFTGIVGESLNRKVIKKRGNGGSITSNLVQLNNTSFDYYMNDDMDFAEVNLYNPFYPKDCIIIFQFSSIGREDFESLTEEEVNMVFDTNVSFKDIIYDRIKVLFDKVDSKLMEIESKYGFKYYYLDWLGDFYDFKPEKFITINGHHYFNMMTATNYIKIPYKDKYICDGHINQYGNSVIARNILKKIQKDLDNQN
jgi:hypothetical protein